MYQCCLLTNLRPWLPLNDNYLQWFLKKTTGNRNWRCSVMKYLYGYSCHFYVVLSICFIRFKFNESLNSIHWITSVYPSLPDIPLLSKQKIFGQNVNFKKSPRHQLSRRNFKNKDFIVNVMKSKLSSLILNSINKSKGLAPTDQTQTIQSFMTNIRSGHGVHKENLYWSPILMYMSRRHRFILHFHARV